MVYAEYFLRDAKVRKPSGLIDKPDVSIILPTYSRAKSGLLVRAIESVLAQSFQSFELIVMDDGSSDGTEDILADYVRADSRVIHVRHEDNCGLPALRVNEGLMLSRGRYCAYQFDDDRWTQQALQILVAALDKNLSFKVAYGQCLFFENGNERLSGEPFNYSRLLESNFIANNSLIHCRSLFERFGGYDMHLVMRRLCDWDLWLRWGRQVRFLFVDELVSLVEIATEGALGKTVPLDTLAARSIMTRNRNHLLRPDMLKNYELDSLDHLKHLGIDKTEEIWRKLVAPYQSRHRTIWPKVALRTERRTHVLVTKAHFDTTVDITINNFSEVLADDFAFTFIPQAQVDKAAIRFCDILLLHRTIDFHAQNLANIAHEQGKCVVFLMDDDLLTIHELSEEFSYLAPGAPCRETLEKLISDADLVITYSPLMQESVKSLNTRNVRLETNIKEKWLEAAKIRHSAGLGITPDSFLPLKIGFAGGEARKEEFVALWPALVAASRQLKSKVEFHFWGFAPTQIDQLESSSYCEGFTFSYNEYLDRLTTSGFDVMIVPLFAQMKAKRAKCPIKFLESTAAGAVGVYSDVEPYQVVQHGITGFKCENTVDAWIDAILKAANSTFDQRLSMHAAAYDYVNRVYTSEQQAYLLSATLNAAKLHAKLRRPSESGRPRIAYFCHSPYLGGAENHLLRHALIAQSFKFEPILVFPASAIGIQDEMQRRASKAGIRVAYLPLIVETETNNRVLDESAISEISSWLVENQISLVHSVTLMQELGEASKRKEIAHVASFYATNSVDYAGIEHCDIIHSDSLFYANKWATVLGVPSRCILSYVPEEFFNIGIETARSEHSNWSKRKLRIGMFGTLQPRKGQLKAVEAIGRLHHEHGIEIYLDIFGYDHFFQDYVDECKSIALHYKVDKYVKFHGFVQNTAMMLRTVDIVLCASDWESMPQTILEGMAARKLIVSPLVGGVGEILSNKCGIVIDNNSAEEICIGLLRAIRLDASDLKSRLELSQAVVQAECSKSSVANSLFKMYIFTQDKSYRRSSGDEGKLVVGHLYKQVSAHRSSRMTRVASFLKRKDVLWESISPVFAELKSYTAQHFKKSFRTRFILSDDLRATQYREYDIPVNVVGLSKVSLAICPLLRASQGTVGIEIVSSVQRVVAQVSIQLSAIQPATPTDFIMPAPLFGLGDTWLLRVFVKNADVPVAIYELVNYSIVSRRVDYMPFVCLQATGSSTASC